MKPALSQVCTLAASFESDVEDYAAGKCPALELWLPKLETYLQQHSVADARGLLEEHELCAPVASYQGGLLVNQAEARREHWGHFRRRLEICRQLGVQTIVVAGDLHGPLEQQDLDRTAVSLQEAGAIASQHGLRVALEFQARATFANNLQTAAAVVAEVGHPAVGLCLDLFHYQTGPSKAEDLAYLSPANLFHVQLSDIVDQARELATDADRILPGDGEIMLGPLMEILTSIGYSDYVSVELMNPTIWQIPPRQFGEIAMTALRKVLGQADMGA